MVPLGKVLRFSGKPERIRKPESEVFVTVRLNGRGAVPRNIGAGKTPVAFTGYRVQSGQFIYSRIDARNGAFAIIPPELDGAVVSKDFPVFDIQTDAVDTRYLIHYFMAGRLQQQIQALSQGATNRQRITEERFLAFTLPLPPLIEQRRIAAILDCADSLRTKRRTANMHFRDLTRSIFIDMFGDPHSTFDAEASIRFGEVAELQGGRNLVAEDSEIESPYRVLRISSVTSGEFKPDESKPLPLEYQPPKDHLVKQGDLLMSRANTAELVGAVAYVYDCPSNLTLPDKIWRFVWRNTESVPLYYWALFSDPSVRRRISRLSSGTGGSMKNISKAKLEQLELPPASIASQREFARRLASIPKPRTNELDELFASLQARAFRGEL